MPCTGLFGIFMKVQFMVKLSYVKEEETDNLVAIFSFSDQFVMDTRFYRSFVNSLPASLKTGYGYPQTLPNELRLSGWSDLQTAVSALKGAVQREIACLKRDCRTCQVRKGVDTTKIGCLRQRITELEMIAPDSDERLKHMRELTVLNQSESCAENLKMIVEDYTEYLDCVIKLEEITNDFRQQRLGKRSTKLAMNELEAILADLIPMAREANRMGTIAASVT